MVCKYCGMPWKKIGHCVECGREVCIICGHEVRENCISKPGSKLTGLSIVSSGMAKPIEMQKNAIEFDPSMPLFIFASGNIYVHNDHHRTPGHVGQDLSPDAGAATNQIDREIHVDPDVGIKRDMANVLPTL